LAKLPYRLHIQHDGTATTHFYLEADLAMKEAALKRPHEPALKALIYKGPDRLLAFLEALRLCGPERTSTARPHTAPGPTTHSPELAIALFSTTLEHLRS
jgi:hypothetical protein